MLFNILIFLQFFFLISWFLGFLARLLEVLNCPLEVLGGPNEKEESKLKIFLEEENNVCSHFMNGLVEVIKKRGLKLVKDVDLDQRKEGCFFCFLEGATNPSGRHRAGISQHESDRNHQETVYFNFF